MSLLLPRLPNIPGQCYSNMLSRPNLDNLRHEEIRPNDMILYVVSIWYVLMYFDFCQRKND